MKLLICGSGASEAIPSIFCRCPICRNAWEKKGKEFRSRVAYQLGEEVRIDFGPDLLLHRYLYGLHLDRLKHLFISHSHRDHYYPEAIGYHHPANSLLPAGELLNFYGSPFVIKRLYQTPNVDVEKSQLNIIELRAGKTIELKDVNMRFTPLVATHAPAEDAFLFAIRLGNGVQILIGTDSAYFCEKTWKAMEGTCFDLVILDATAGKITDSKVHMSSEKAVETAMRMRKSKMVHAGSRIITNHFCHAGGMTHADLEKFFGPFGIEAAYDGMEIDLTPLSKAE